MWLTSSVIDFTYHQSFVIWGENYTDAYRDIDSIQATLCKNDFLNDILDSVIRIDKTGYPNEFKSDSSRENFYKYKNYVNYTDIIRNTDKVEKAMNKDDKRFFPLFSSVFYDLLPTSSLIYIWLLKTYCVKTKIIDSFGMGHFWLMRHQKSMHDNVYKRWTKTYLWHSLVSLLKSHLECENFISHNRVSPHRWRCQRSISPLQISPRRYQRLCLYCLK